MRMAREDVYKLIDGERAYQDRRWPDSGATEVGSQLALIESYTRRAIDAWSNEKGDQGGLDAIRKVAALCVRAMEMQGAPPRA